MKQAQRNQDLVLRRARPILAKVRKFIDGAAGRRPLLKFKIRRYIYKQLSYDERGKPATRRLLKHKKYRQQRGVCTWCHRKLRQAVYAELDRKVAWKGYTESNTQLIHARCHHAQQRARGYRAVSF